MVAGTEGLGQHVLDARRFHHRPHTAAGDDTGAGRRRTQQYTSAAELADDLVRDRVLMHGNLDHRLAGRFGSLADGLRYFVGLAESTTHLAIVVTRDDQRAEREPATTLHDLGASVDEHNLFGRLTSDGRAVLTRVTLTITAATIPIGLLAWRHKEKELQVTEAEMMI